MAEYTAIDFSPCNLPWLSITILSNKDDSISCDLVLPFFYLSFSIAAHRREPDSAVKPAPPVTGLSHRNS